MRLITYLTLIYTCLDMHFEFPTWFTAIKFQLHNKDIHSHRFSYITIYHQLIRTDSKVSLPADKILILKKSLKKTSKLSLVFNFHSEKRMCLNKIFLAKSLLTIDVCNDFVECAVFIC